MLSSTTGDEVTFAFKADELNRMFDEPDVEAQGLRERMAILTVAATTAAGIGAGVAGAMPANLVSESGGGGGTTAAFVTDTTSSGPAAEAGTVSNLVTDTTSSGPQALAGRTGCVPHRRDEQRAAGRDRRGHGLQPRHRHDEQRRPGPTRG